MSPELDARLIHPVCLYLDHLATTPVDARAADAVKHALLLEFGNPNSPYHAFGGRADRLIADAAAHVTGLLGAPAERLLFTSGASEALALAVRHAVDQRLDDSVPLQVVASPLEHAALLEALEDHARAGEVHVRWLRVDARGQLDLDHVRQLLDDGADLVCVMAANNELGTIYPVQKIARLTSSAGAVLLVDATQAAGRIPLDVEGWGLAYVAVSAHKMYGPKGVGALIALEGPMPKRRGTPNVPGIAGFGEAARWRQVEMHDDERRIGQLRDRLQALLLASVPRMVINGDLANRLACSLHVSVADAPNDAVLARLHDQVALSTGAACAGGALSDSHVLRAIGMPAHERAGALRMAVGKFTTSDEIDLAARAIAVAIHVVRRDVGTPA